MAWLIVGTSALAWWAAVPRGPADAWRSSRTRGMSVGGRRSGGEHALPRPPGGENRASTEPGAVQ